MSPEPDRTTDEVAEQVFAGGLGMMQTLSIYLGDQLGWYAALHREGPATPAQLAARTATSARYAREWLEQQAVYGLLQVDGSGPERSFVLPPSTAEVILDADSLSYLGPLARMLAATGPKLPELLDAYRTGGGVSWDDLGPDAREGQGAMNRPLFRHHLEAALRGVPGLDAILRRPGARILDVGCGLGWSTIALATAYPAAEVIGIDIDEPSVELARANASSAGVDADRLSFRTADGGGLGSAGESGFDIAFAFECVHDMPRPVDVLTAVRAALRPEGALVVMDEAVAEEFVAPGDDVERFMYGFSLLVCLPDGMSSAPSEGTGTVMRPNVLRGYAERAGFDNFEVLPIEDFGFFRFYRLS